MRFFETLVGSFHSAETYRQTRKTANFFMGYTLLVVILCTLAITVYYAAILHREVFVARNGNPPLFDDLVSQIARQLPVMTYSEHRLATKDPAPTVITVTGEAFGERFENFALATIDTSGIATHETMQTPVLITHKEVFVKKQNETEIYPLDKYEERSTIVINRALIDETANRLIQGMHTNLGKIYLVVGGICWFVFAIFFYIMRLCMLLVLGLTGLLVSSIVRTPLTFPQAFSLAAVSYTPIAIMDTIAFTLFAYTLQTITLLFAGVVALTIAIVCSREPAAVTT